MKENYVKIVALGYFTTGAKYESGLPGVKPFNAMFSPDLKELTVRDNNSGKIIFSIKKEDVINIEVVKSENLNKSWLNFETKGEFDNNKISFVSSKPEASQYFTDIKYNLQKFWQSADETDSKELFREIKKKEEEKNKSTANGCLVAGVIIVILFVIFIFTDKKDSKSTANSSDNISSTTSESKDPKLLFSSWDGSLPAFKDYVEKNLKDPDSFEHVETSYRDDGDGLTVKMKYRGKNSFNAVVTQEATAKVDYEGNVVTLISHK